MSTLAASGEMTPRELASRVLTLFPFRKISTDDFRTLLRHLADTDCVNITEEGELILGMAAEKLVNSFRFFAVFRENIEYTVRSGSEELGTIVRTPPAGDKIAIAGRVWVTDEVDNRRRVVCCTLVKGRIPACFGDAAGDIHTRILERLKGVLAEEKPYPYLMCRARARLADARAVFRKSGMDKRALISLGGSMWVLFPWLGTYFFLALERFLKIRCAERLGLQGLSSARPCWMQFRMKAGDGGFLPDHRRRSGEGLRSAHARLPE